MRQRPVSNKTKHRAQAGAGDKAMTIEGEHSLEPEQLGLIMTDGPSVIARGAFAPHAFDGTEIHYVIDQELCGLEHTAAAAAIKAAIKQKYQDAVPLDAVVEIIAQLIEITWA
jgi:hypothetical protein